jgi:uncharacterized protein (DUF1499 family)
MADTPERTNRMPGAVIAGAILVLVSLLIMAIGPLGSRWEWWHFRTGFTLLRYGAYALIATSLLTLLAALFIPSPAKRRSVMMALLLAVVALGVIAVPWSMRRVARSVPPIHDISTDTENPPQFVAVLPLRTGASNPPEYPGEEFATHQRRAYPEIQPLMMAIPPAEALARAEQTARRMGWELVAVDSAALRVEAVARTRWFGFRDDVVVRITPEGSGSRVDVRSKSRVGRSDVGANARRIRSFMAMMEAG